MAKIYEPWCLDCGVYYNPNNVVVVGKPRSWEGKYYRFIGCPNGHILGRKRMSRFEQPPIGDTTIGAIEK